MCSKSTPCSSENQRICVTRGSGSSTLRSTNSVLCILTTVGLLSLGTGALSRLHQRERNGVFTHRPQDLLKVI